MSNIVSKVPDAQVMADLDACVAWAKANGGDTSRLGITGFCWGGRITWLYSAHNPQVKAGVAWYGRVASPVTENNPKHPVDIAGQLHAPVLGALRRRRSGHSARNGGEDACRPCRRQQGRMRVENPRFDGAPHAFHADYRPSYRKAEAEDGWQRMLAWFKRNGV